MSHSFHDSAALLQTTGLRELHFADLLRFAQLIADPSGGLSGRSIQVDWDSFGITTAVYADLFQLGRHYLYASPNIPPAEIWPKLNPITRAWLIENKKLLTTLEEAFPARDED